LSSRSDISDYSATRLPRSGKITLQTGLDIYVAELFYGLSVRIQPNTMASVATEDFAASSLDGLEKLDVDAEDSKPTQGTTSAEQEQHDSPEVGEGTIELNDSGDEDLEKQVMDYEEARLQTIRFVMPSRRG
jgi:hypothetical protein